MSRRSQRRAASDRYALSRCTLECRDRRWYLAQRSSRRMHVTTKRRTSLVRLGCRKEYRRVGPLRREAGYEAIEHHCKTRQSGSEQKAASVRLKIKVTKEKARKKR
jgi:hypothetical protein